MAFDPTTFKQENFWGATVKSAVGSLLDMNEAAAPAATPTGAAGAAGVLLTFAAPASAKLGSAGKTIYCWLFPDDRVEGDAPGILLFYQPSLTPEDTDGLLEAGSKCQPLLTAVTANNYWLFHCTVEGYAVPDEMCNAIPSDAGLQESLKGKAFARENNLLNIVTPSQIKDVFNFPAELPFDGTVLVANFAESHLSFSVTLKDLPKAKWIGDAFQFKQLEAGFISSYNGEGVSFNQVYLAADVELWGNSASFFAQLDLEGTSPVGMSFEIHPHFEIQVTGGLSKLGELISGAEMNIPEGIPVPNISIDHFTGYIHFKNGLTRLSGKVHATFGDNGWSPFGSGGEDLFNLQEVGVEFNWQKGVPVNWEIAGNVLIENYALHASYVHPAKIISVELSPSNKANDGIKSFLESKLSVPPAASEIVASVLTAVDLSLYYDITNKELDFRVRNHAAWNLIPDILSVSAMDFRIKRAGGAFAYAELFCELVLPIGPTNEGKRSDVTIDLDGVYDATDTPALWHFEAEINDPIAVGDLIAGLAEKFGAPTGAIPDQISGLTLDDLYLSFDHQGENSQLKFSGNLICPISEDKDLTLHLEVGVKKTDRTGEPGSKASWEVRFGTYILVAGYQFAVDFESNEAGKFLIASLSSDAKFNLSSLLEEIAPGDIDSLIPDDLELGLQNAFIAFYSPKAPTPPPPGTPPTKTTVVFGLELEIGGKLDLGQVPGIGPLLGKAVITLESMRIVGSTVDISANTLTVIDRKLDDKGIKGLADGQPLTNTAPATPTAGAVPPPAFRKGVSLAAELKLPGLVVKLAHFFGAKPAGAGVAGASTAGTTLPGTPQPATTTPAATKPAAAAAAAATAPVPAAPQKNRMLTPVGQQIGPLFVESIGLAMMDGKFGLKFTGGVIMGPMVLELINFSVVSPFDHFEPFFDLDGIAIGYDKMPLTVSGLLMKVEEKLPEGATETTITRQSIGFQGGISIGFKQISITALGAYSHVKMYKPPGTYDRAFHSFFLYGYLGAPLGGPPFLFVTGLALGVGFNRGLNLPKPEEFGIFPLTAAALKPSGTALTVTDLKDMMLSLDRYIPIKEGNFWFAAGIKFESFKFLSGFLMLTVEFGDELEIGVLGILDAIMPVGAPNPIIRISIGFTVRILPERGVVEVKGSFLPTTFILHKDVKLQGGMALLAIMKDQNDGEWAGARSGEFVFTLGGYGPLYHPKPYYPTVPALQLDWKVNENLFISASAYFALTPEAIMLGGHFHGHFDYAASIVSIAVDLKLDADFIIFWQPLRYLGEVSAVFHLKGSIHVEFAFISVDKSLSLDASAKMSIWGPDFSGKANLKLHFFVSFEVEVEFGAAGKEIKAIEWTAFKESLLPPADKVVSLSLAGGLVQDSVQRVIPTVNPHEAKLVLDTQIPLKTIGGKPVPLKEKDGKPIKPPPSLGIKPMGLEEISFNSDVVFTITAENNPAFDFKAAFDFKPVYKNVPAALWQPASKAGEIPQSDGQDLIEGVVCGYELTAIRPGLRDGQKIAASSLDDDLMGQVGKIAPLDGFDWSAQLVFPKELIDAFHTA